VGEADRGTIVRALREVFDGPAWHGPSVRQVLRGVGARRAAWRPAPGRNTIWDLVLHLAVARHILLARLTGARAAFPRKRHRTWWAPMPARGTEAAWRDDVALLVDYQARLIAAIERAPAARLARRRAGHTVAHELLHEAVHDAYHAGQIALLARLAR
jgi:uncharacterized damage-inducible protein DinB